MLIDTHSHIFSEEFDNDRQDVINSAKENGVKALIVPNIDKESIAPLKHTVQNFSDFVFPLMGLHPSSVTDDYIEELDFIKQELFSNKYYGVGEIGMDLYWETEFQKQQEEVFYKQCLWANELNLPVSIHTRNSFDQVIDVIKSLPQIPKGIFHCFGGSVSQANEVISLGFYLGIGGVVSFKNSDLRNVLSNVEIENLVLETDSPYLAPHPKRGKRNEPIYLDYIIDSLVKIYDKTPEQIINITGENANKIFNLF